MNALQDSDYKWFVSHLAKLFNKYGDVFLAIKNQTVLGTYDTYGAAVKATEKKEQLGTFIVQQCAPDLDSCAAHIFSPNLW